MRPARPEVKSSAHSFRNVLFRRSIAAMICSTYATYHRRSMTGRTHDFEQQRRSRCRATTDAIRRDRRPARCDFSREARGSARHARAERRGQDHHDRDPRGVPHAVGRPGRGAGGRSRTRRRRLARPDRRRAPVLARPRASGGCASCSPTSARTTPVLHGTDPPAVGHRRTHRRWSGSPSSATRRSPRCPAASGAGSTWRSASSAGPNCCSWTNRPRASTPPPAATSTTWCTAWPTWRTPPSCSPPTTWTRPRNWPTGS